MAKSKIKAQKEADTKKQTDESANMKDAPKEQGKETHDKKATKSSKISKKDTRDELAEWKEKTSEINDKYLRLYSDFDNFRKRTLKEKLELSKTASEEVIVELLPILDDFERALKAAETSAEKTPMFVGMELIYNKLKNTLEKKGLKAIEAKEEAFDTDFHEAITYIPAPSSDLKGKVVDEIEKGYLLGEKVIRYTKVVIGQ